MSPPFFVSFSHHRVFLLTTSQSSPKRFDMIGASADVRETLEAVEKVRREDSSDRCLDEPPNSYSCTALSQCRFAVQAAVSGFSIRQLPYPHFLGAIALDQREAL